MKTHIEHYCNYMKMLTVLTSWVIDNLILKFTCSLSTELRRFVLFRCSFYSFPGSHFLIDSFNRVFVIYVASLVTITTCLSGDPIGVLQTPELSLVLTSDMIHDKWKMWFLIQWFSRVFCIFMSFTTWCSSFAFLIDFSTQVQKSGLALFDFSTWSCWPGSGELFILFRIHSLVSRQ